MQRNQQSYCLWDGGAGVPPTIFIPGHKGKASAPDQDYTAVSPNNWDWARWGYLDGSKSLSGSQNQDAPGWSSGMPRVEPDPYNPHSSSPNFFSVTQHRCSFPAPGTSVPEAYLRAV